MCSIQSATAVSRQHFAEVRFEANERRLDEKGHFFS
jgi:hypothetical protein